MRVIGQHETEFREFFTDVYEDALRFAQRRSTPDRAEDAVADAILVAWRRFDDSPSDFGERRAWLFGIVRNTLLNTSRSEARQTALAVRIAGTSAVTEAPDHAEQVAQRVDLARAWSHLTSAEQECLSFGVFEQLTAAQAAAVLGISTVAYRARLARARRSLQSELSQPRQVHTELQIQEVTS